MVQHTVDVGVAVFGAETLHRFHRFVQHHAIRHVDAVLQFVGGDAQRGALDGVNLFHRAVEIRRQRGVEFGAVRVDAVDEFLEVHEVGDFARLLVCELGDDVAGVGAGHLPRVQRLQRAAAGAGAQHGVYAIGAAVKFAHGSFSSRLAISMATSAASSPLLPWLPPARASACS